VNDPALAVHLVSQVNLMTLSTHCKSSKILVLAVLTHQRAYVGALQAADQATSALLS
jgi:hypothetical protein